MFGRSLLLVAPLALFAVPARAEAPPTRAPRATLVEVLRGGKQVLVLDRTTGDYTVMKVGDAIQGFRITAIEDDQIVLVSPKPERHFVLPLFDPTPLPAKKQPPAAPATVVPPPAAPATAAPPTVAPAIDTPPTAAPPAADPLADGVIDDVMDPYGPTDAPATEPPPVAAAPAAPTSTPPAAAGPTPAPAAPAAAKAPAPKSVKRKLSRKELNRALADFAALTRDIKIERATGGGILVSDLAKGSFPARVGIEKGDIVRRVAGHAIDTVDDAASAYAAVMAAKQVVVEIERRGARLQLTYQLTD
jgi:hypothetical protein